MSIFYQFGDITSVRVLRPGKEIPHDLRDGLGKLILTDIAAVVEFETTESAANAFHRFSINNEIAFDNVPYELNVSLMGTGMEEELDSGKYQLDPNLGWIPENHNKPEFGDFHAIRKYPKYHPKIYLGPKYDFCGFQI